MPRLSPRPVNTPQPPPASAPTPLAYSVEDAAAAMAISVSLCRQLIADGTIRACRFRKRKVVVSADEIRRVLEAHITPASS